VGIGRAGLMTSVLGATENAGQNVFGSLPLCVLQRVLIKLLARRCIYHHSERSTHATDLSPSPSVCLSVCLSVQKVYCDKTAERIRMPFEVMSGIG